MKKILTFLIIMFLSVGAISAQALDMEAMLEALNSGNSADVDLSAFAGTIDAAAVAEIEISLYEEGYTVDQVNSTLDIVEGIDAGNWTTLEDLENDDAFDFDIVDDMVADAIISQIADEVLANGDTAALTEAIDALGNTLSVLSGFADANAQTSVASSMFGLQGYKLFAVQVGILGSVSYSSEISQTALGYFTGSSTMDDLTTLLEDEGLSLGIGLQGFSANVGLNFSWLVDRLYLGVVFGSLSMTAGSDGIGIDILGTEITLSDEPIEDLPMEAVMTSQIFGITANYQLIKSWGIPIILKWTGVSLGSGFIYTGYDIVATSDLTSLLAPDAPDTGGEPLLSAEFSLTNTAFTIPLEVSTGIKVMSVLTLKVAAGADLKFGKTNISFDVDSSQDDSFTTKLLTGVIEEVIEGSGMEFPYSEDYSPSFINPRISAGLGIGLGPVSLNFNAHYFFLPDFQTNTEGLALGASIIVAI
ncbi:MAG: hypothetical protein OCD02_14225 [Spirochaetaceae bacterium]